MMTKSPTFTARTSAPTAGDGADRLVAHAPRPPSSGTMSLYGHRSLPQIQPRQTGISASVGSTIPASGTSSTRTSPAPCIMVARIAI